MNRPSGPILVCCGVQVTRLLLLECCGKPRAATATLGSAAFLCPSIGDTDCPRRKLGLCWRPSCNLHLSDQLGILCHVSRAQNLVPPLCRCMPRCRSAACVLGPCAEKPVIAANMRGAPHRDGPRDTHFIMALRIACEVFEIRRPPHCPAGCARPSGGV